MKKAKAVASATFLSFDGVVNADCQRVQDRKMPKKNKINNQILEVELSKITKLVEQHEHNLHTFVVPDKKDCKLVT